MVLMFSEKEKKYLTIIKGDWKVKSDCPPKIKKRIKRKLDLLYSSNYVGG